MTRPRLLFHCQHSVGLGHLVRSVHLADGLAQDFDVTLLNGGPWPADLPAADHDRRRAPAARWASTPTTPWSAGTSGSRSRRPSGSAGR